MEGFEGLVRGSFGKQLKGTNPSKENESVRKIKFNYYIQMNLNAEALLYPYKTQNESYYYSTGPVIYAHKFKPTKSIYKSKNF